MAASLAAAAPPNPRAARIDAFFQRLHEAAWFSGVVVVSAHGRLLYERGFGLANREEGVAFTPDTPSDGGSLAKTFTAVAVMELVNEGRIDLTAPVHLYVPEFRLAGVRPRHRQPARGERPCGIRRHAAVGSAAAARRRAEVAAGDCRGRAICSHSGFFPA